MNTTIKIKISGDGTNIGKRLKLENITYIILNENNVTMKALHAYVPEFLKLHQNLEYFTFRFISVLHKLGADRNKNTGHQTVGKASHLVKTNYRTNPAKKDHLSFRIPEAFDSVIKAVKTVCNFTRRSVRVPSLALKLVYSLSVFGLISLKKIIALALNEPSKMSQSKQRKHDAGQWLSVGAPLSCSGSRGMVSCALLAWLCLSACFLLFSHCLLLLYPKAI